MHAVVLASDVNPGRIYVRVEKPQPRAGQSHADQVSPQYLVALCPVSAVKISFLTLSVTGFLASYAIPLFDRMARIGTDIMFIGQIRPLYFIDRDTMAQTCISYTYAPI